MIPNVHHDKIDPSKDKYGYSSASFKDINLKFGVIVAESVFQLGLGGIFLFENLLTINIQHFAITAISGLCKSLPRIANANVELMLTPVLRRRFT